MKQTSFRPYHLFGFVALIAGLASILVSKRQTLDIHVHETYIIVGLSSLLQVVALLFLLAWVVYLLLRRRRTSTGLTLAHLLLLFAGAAALIVQCQLQQSARSDADFSLQRNLRNIPQFALLALGLAQVLFLVNVVLGLVRGKRRG